MHRQTKQNDLPHSLHDTRKKLPNQYTIHPLENEQKTDLKIFEQHLRYKYGREAHTAKKYKGFLLLIILVSVSALCCIYFSINAEQSKQTLVIGCSLIITFFVCGFHTTKIRAPKIMIERCNAILRIFRIKFNEEKQRLVRLKFISKNAQLMAHAAEAETEAFDRSHLRRVETIKFN